MIRNLHNPEWGWLAKVWMTQGAGRAWNHLEMSSLVDQKWLLAGASLQHSTWTLHVGHFGLPHSMVSQSK